MNNLTTTLSLNTRIILRSFLILSLLATLALVVFYIFQVNAQVTERYLIQEYDEELGKALVKRQNMEINLVESDSLDKVMALMAEYNFEKPEKIHYIKVLDNQVVIVK